MQATNRGSALLLVLLAAPFVSSSAQEANTASLSDYRFVSHAGEFAGLPVGGSTKADWPGMCKHSTNTGNGGS